MEVEKPRWKNSAKFKELRKEVL